jgi:hypothetical protein
MYRNQIHVLRVGVQLHRKKQDLVVLYETKCTTHPWCWTSMCASRTENVTPFLRKTTFRATPNEQYSSLWRPGKMFQNTLLLDQKLNCARLDFKRHSNRYLYQNDNNPLEINVPMKYFYRSIQTSSWCSKK